MAPKLVETYYKNNFEKVEISYAGAEQSDHGGRF